MRPTTAGIVFVLAGLSLCIGAYRFSLPGLLPAGILLLALVVLSALLALLTGTRLHTVVHLATPYVRGVPVTTVGTEAEVVVRMRNRLPYPVGPFGLSVEPSAGTGERTELEIARVATRRELAVPVGLVPTRRGIGAIDAVTASFDGPFALVRMRKKLGSVPRVARGPLRFDSNLARHLGASGDQGDHLSVRRGASSRDFHTREYVPGDDLRHVHWASTAKLGEIMVRTEADEPQMRVALVLDASGSQDTPETAEALVSTVATLVHRYVDNDFDVTVRLAGRALEPTSARDFGELSLALAELDPAVPVSEEDLADLPVGVHTIVLTHTRERAEFVVGRLPRRNRVQYLVTEDHPARPTLSEDLFDVPVDVPPEWTLRTGKPGR